MTAPAPTVCATCSGEGVVEFTDPHASEILLPCPDCGCPCGRGPRFDALMCEDCRDDLDDDRRLVRASDR